MIDWACLWASFQSTKHFKSFLLGNPFARSRFSVMVMLVLRDGTYVGEKEAAAVDIDEMIRMMVGRNVTQYYPKSGHKAGAPALEVENLSLPRLVKNVSLQARKGEVLGIGGLVGVPSVRKPKRPSLEKPLITTLDQILCPINRRYR